MVTNGESVGVSTEFVTVGFNTRFDIVDEINFRANEVVSLPITLACYDDGTGESIHIFTTSGAEASQDEQGGGEEEGGEEEVVNP